MYGPAPATIRQRRLAPGERARLTRLRIRVQQKYRYAYASPVTDLRQRLVMLPPDCYGDQQLIDHDLTIRGAVDGALSVQTDPFGNRIAYITAPAVPEAVEFAADFTVERRLARTPVRLPASTDLALYLAPTALTAPCDRIRQAADEISAEVDAGGAELALPGAVRRLCTEGYRLWASAARAGQWAAGAIGYRSGVTGAQTPAAIALHLGHGVSQDYAHIALALLRQLRVPARYVSGHRLGEGAAHAWVEALLPDPDAPAQLRAVAYDPTHRQSPGLDYVTVAVGRDFADITPTSGTFTGVPGKLSAGRDAWVVEAA